MRANDNSGPRLEIGHVLAMDVVGYSKLLIHEQSELLQRLNEIVRGTDQFRHADTDGKLIRLPTGDGMALVFLATSWPWTLLVTQNWRHRSHQTDPMLDPLRDNPRFEKLVHQTIPLKDL